MLLDGKNNKIIYLDNYEIIALELLSFIAIHTDVESVQRVLQG